MLLQLHTGQVPGYVDGQAAMVYLVASAQAVAAAGCRFVFYDGHALARLSTCYDDLAQLSHVDWRAVSAKQWSTRSDPDLRRRKQAEFLVHEALPWDLIRGIGVLDATAEANVQALLAAAPPSLHRQIAQCPQWYY